MPRTTVVLALALLATAALPAQSPKPEPTPAEATILKQLRSLRAVPDPQRPAVTTQIALDIRALPPGLPKLRLADGLSHLATEGDAGHATLQAVASTLAQALAENPLPAKTTPGQPETPPGPYSDLARLARYEHVDPAYPSGSGQTTLTDPLYSRALDLLAAEDASIEQADFTLRDLHNKPVTLSALRGKIVLVNFWATWCPPCRKEMPDLDAIYTHFQSQGLVILSISDEEMQKVGPFIAQSGYHPPVLLDPGSKVHAQFHVEGIPKSFVFDRQGKLVAQSIDMRTQHQFLELLAQAGLHP